MGPELKGKITEAFGKKKNAKSLLLQTSRSEKSIWHKAGTDR